ncbi:MAG: 2TM domain-containing protein [Bacteroidota bacterium]
MNRKLYKTAYQRVLERKYFYRHLILFVMGNFVLFFLSVGSWTPAIFYLLTLIWIRVLALHFANAYPEVVKDFGFKTQKQEEKAIEKELKKIKKERKKAKVQRKEIEEKEELPLQPLLIKNNGKSYNESELV